VTAGEGLAFGVPGMVLLLLALGAYELRPSRRRRRAGTPLSATYVNEVTALFYGSKRVELDHRDSWSMLREDDAQGAPPGLGVDLDNHTVILPRHGGGAGDGRRCPADTAGHRADVSHDDTPGQKTA
jgi:hypothetical protein